jgi:hypothetical protein
MARNFDKMTANSNQGVFYDVLESKMGQSGPFEFGGLYKMLLVDLLQFHRTSF